MRYVLLGGGLLGCLLTSSLCGAVCDSSRALSGPEMKSCSQNGMGCAYFEPLNHDSAVKYPLVIFLHGAGSAGTDGVRHIDDGWTCQLQELMEPANRAAHPAFVLAPQAPNSITDAADPNAGAFVTWNWQNTNSYDINTLPESPTLQEARRMMAALQSQYPNIDADRIYVMGVSMGGYGTWDLIGRTPEIFAAGVPADGGGSPQAAAGLRNLAVWSFHNADDPVPIDSDRAMFAALAQAGARPFFSEGRRGGHYGMVRPGQMGFLPWMFAQRRGVPSTPTPYLVVSPQGGTFPEGPVTITISSDPPSHEIRYTTDLRVPSTIDNIGELYFEPITLTESAVLMLASHYGAEDEEVTLLHAMPFQIGNSPLPPGAVAVEPGVFAPSPGGGPTTGSGGAAAGSTGGVTHGQPHDPGSTAEDRPPSSRSGGCQLAPASTLGSTALLGLGLLLGPALLRVRAKARGSR